MTKLQNKQIKSTKRKIKAGVPQGSMLGPLLFNIYIADILNTKSCNIAPHVDDTMIYIHDRNPYTMRNRLQQDLDTILE